MAIALEIALISKSAPDDFIVEPESVYTFVNLLELIKEKLLLTPTIPPPAAIVSTVALSFDSAFKVNAPAAERFEPCPTNASTVEFVLETAPETPIESEPTFKLNVSRFEFVSSSAVTSRAPAEFTTVLFPTKAEVALFLSIEFVTSTVPDFMPSSVFSAAALIASAIFEFAKSTASRFCALAESSFFLTSLSEYEATFLPILEITTPPDSAYIPPPMI